MKIAVKLFASLRKYVPAGASDPVVIEVQSQATVREVLRCLGIPPEHAHMVVAGDEQLELGAPVREGQELRVYPPLAGGMAT